MKKLFFLLVLSLLVVNPAFATEAEEPVIKGGGTDPYVFQNVVNPFVQPEIRVSGNDIYIGVLATQFGTATWLIDGASDDAVVAGFGSAVTPIDNDNYEIVVGSEEVSTYHVLETTLPSGEYFIRLMLTDKNGNVSYSWSQYHIVIE